jgi:hypothetical protein
MDALRISPRYTSLDWKKLNANDPNDWANAAEIVRDRLNGRFLRFASKCLKDRDSGFVVLAIDSLVAETIQQFIEGITNGHARSRETFKRFLEGTRFQPDFDADARHAFYSDIRCGLLHQAEAKKMWLIRRETAPWWYGIRQRRCRLGTSAENSAIPVNFVVQDVIKGTGYRASE